MTPGKSISRKLLCNMSLVVTTLVLLLGGLQIAWEYQRFQRQVATLWDEELGVRQRQLKRRVQEVLSYLDYKKSQVDGRVRHELASHVRQAKELLSHLSAVKQAGRDGRELEMLLPEVLRPLRFNNGRGYYFIFAMDGTVRLHAARPELEGKNLLNLQDEEGTFVIREMIALARERGEGFVSYRWPKPENPAGPEFEKLSFVAYLPGVEWLVGAGEYLVDMEEEVKREVLARVGSIRFGKDGYVFAGQWDGRPLSFPAEGALEFPPEDAHGGKVVAELITLARGDGGFLRYSIPRTGEAQSHEKISYVQGVPEWQWYVGAGIFLDDLKGAIQEARQKLQREISEQLALIIFLLLAALGMGLFLVRRMAGQLRTAFKTFEDFFARAASERLELAGADLRFAEFQSLGASADRMLAERRLIEDALREKEQQYRSIYTNIADALLILAPDGRIVEANAAARRQYGYSFEEFSALSVQALSHPESREVWDRFLVEVRESGFFFGETRERRKDGILFFSELTGTSIMRRGRQHLVAIVRDISERKQSELLVRKSEEKYRALVETTGTGFVILDSQGRVRDANAEYVRLSGHADREEILGRQVWEWTAEHDLRRGREAIRQCFGQEGAVRHLQIDYVDGAGRPTPVEINATLVQGEEGPEIIVICRDVSGKKQLEDQLRQAQKMEAIGTLAGGIAHDFNNILSIIYGYTEMALLENTDPEEQRQHLGAVLTGAKRAKDLVQQILAFSRKSEQQKQPLLVAPIVKEALKMLRASLPTTIEIRQKIDSDGAVLADPTQIHQVIMNLCTNAYHAMRETGGVLDVALTEATFEPGAYATADLRPGRYLLLEVSDTGCGIDPEIREKIFEPYFTTKKHGEGTGLGLAVAHGIVKSCRGQIMVASEKGRGTSMRVYLPMLERERESAPVPPGETGEGDRGRGERILLVDDEAQICAYLGELLRRGGYAVSGFSDGEEAWREFAKAPESFDLLISDMTMPHMTGLELARKVLDLRPALPVILCTGHSVLVDREGALALGVREYLHKPVSRQEMLAAVRRALEAAASA